MSRAGGTVGELTRHLADRVGLALILLAAALQFQLTLTIGGTPIRMSAADLLSAPLAIGLLAQALRHGWQGPRWRVPGLWLWLGLLTASMTSALVLGRLHGGDWLSWALFNKYAGWFVLLWYFLLGGWLTAQGGNPVERFILPFLACAAAISAYSVVSLLLNAFFAIQAVGGFDGYRAVGFMDNPNAFGMLLATAVAVQMPLLVTAPPDQAARHRVILTLLMLGLVLSLSRSAWLGLAVALASAAVLRALALRPVLMASAVAIGVSGVLIYGLPSAEHAPDGASSSGPAGLFAWTMQKNIAERAFEFEDYGSHSRLEAAERAVEMWRERPLLGIGLGSFLRSEMEADKKFPSIIHNTALWLLTETGLVGALAFAGFFIACLFALGRKLERSDGGDRLIRIAAIGALAVFTGASVGTEAMYQRYFWFIAGAALALPPAALRAAADRPRAAA